ALILSSARLIADRAVNAPELVQEIRLAALLLCCLMLNRFVADALAGFEAWRAVALMSAAQGVLLLPAMSLLASDYGLSGAVVALTAAAAAGMLVGGVALRLQCARSGVALHVAGAWGERGVIWQFSLPAVLTSLTVGPVYWLMCALLANVPSGYDELGVLMATLQWRNVAMYVPGAMSFVLLPVLAQLHGAGDVKRFERAVVTQVQMLWLATIPLAVGVVCLADWLLGLYGEGFPGNELLLTLVLLGAPFYCLSMSLGNALLSVGRAWLRLVVFAVSGVALIGVTVGLAPVLGALGLAVAYVAGYSLRIAWELIVLRSARIARASVLLLVASGVQVGGAYALSRSGLIAPVALAALLCPASVLIGWTSAPRDVRKALTRVVGQRLTALLPRRRTGAAGEVGP
ncbi:MAG: hypothetical protein AMK73_01445, partial [Planctomycetes bacterium SM23_32]